MGVKQKIEICVDSLKPVGIFKRGALSLFFMVGSQGAAKGVSAMPGFGKGPHLQRCTWWYSGVKRTKYMYDGTNMRCYGSYVMTWTPDVFIARLKPPMAYTQTLLCGVLNQPTCFRSSDRITSLRRTKNFSSMGLTP